MKTPSKVASFPRRRESSVLSRVILYHGQPGSNPLTRPALSPKGERGREVRERCRELGGTGHQFLPDMDPRFRGGDEKDFHFLGWAAGPRSLRMTGRGTFPFPLSAFCFPPSAFCFLDSDS
jgi:hypothetical protein